MVGSRPLVHGPHSRLTQRHLVGVAMLLTGVALLFLRDGAPAFAKAEADEE